MTKRKATPLKPRNGAPININATTWLYVEDKGLCVVHRGDIFHLPWSKVRLAVSEKSKPLPRMK